MRVAIVQCPVWGTREPPLAVVQLAACLKAAGVETRSFDMNNHLYRNRPEGLRNLWAWEQSLFWYDRDAVETLLRGDLREQVDGFADSVLEYRPDIVAFSVAASSYPASVMLAGLLREKAPAVKVVFGGTVFFDPSYLEKTFAEAPVDFVITGEADTALPELVERIDRGSTVAECAGIHYRAGERIVFTGPRPLLENLDRLPYMDFSDLRSDDYEDSEHILLMASRGCVWNCAFCSSRAFWHGYRYMSGERIHQEICHQRMLNRKIGHVDFADLAFNGEVERIREFSRLMVMYPPYPPDFKVYWVANAIITDKMTPDLLELMKKAGCKRLIFGIESGSERVLRLMRKGYRPAVARRVLKDAYDAGIAVTCNFMFGFPGETEEDFRETLDFIGEVGPYMKRVYPSRTYCALEEYSFLRDHPEKFGIRTPVTHHLYWETLDGENTYPVRLDRCRRFEKRCEELGVSIDCGVRTSVDLESWFSLGMYYEYREDYDTALSYYHRYLKEDPHNKVIVDKVASLMGRAG